MVLFRFMLSVVYLYLVCSHYESENTNRMLLYPHTSHLNCFTTPQTSGELTPAQISLTDCLNRPLFTFWSALYPSRPPTHPCFQYFHPSLTLSDHAYPSLRLLYPPFLTLSIHPSMLPILPQPSSVFQSSHLIPLFYPRRVPLWTSCALIIHPSITLSLLSQAQSSLFVKLY